MSQGRGIYARMLDFARPYYGRLALAVLCFALAAGLEGLSAHLIKTVMDDGFLNADKAEARQMLVLLPLGIVAILFFKGLFSYLADLLNNGVSNKLVVDLRGRLFAHLTQLPLSYHSHQRVGGLTARLSYDATNMQAGISDVVGRVIGSGLRILVMAGVIFHTNWVLALQVAVIFPLAMGPLYYFGRRIRRFASQDQERLADLNALAGESLSGMRVVQAFGMEAHERHRFHQASLAHYHALMKKLRAAALSSPVMEIIGGLGVALMIYLAGSHVVEGRMTMGDFLKLIFAVASLYPQVKALNGVNVSIQNAIAAGTRVFEVLDTPVAIADRPGAVELAAPRSGIRFDKVGFAYLPGRPVIQDLDFELKAGTRVAVVGRSGAGKSTLADLLPRFQDVGSGAVLWDGLDIRQAKLASLRAHIGVVTQETFLFNESIAANIAYGRPGASRAEVEEAAKAANAHAFILEQPQGYDTKIGERGVRLSGGQRQRLSIARAILKNPPVLILDEATSSLDTESERQVQEALERLMKGRSTLVIAHRLSTIQKADEILVLDKGRLAERGRHDELLARGGLYARLYEMQFERTVPKAKAVFLDRDGTVSVEMGYIHEKDLDRYALVPGAAQGMRRLQDAGYKLVLVTNQSGVARGYYPESTVGSVHARLAELLGEQGVRLDAVYYCPHHAEPAGPNDTGETGTPGRVAGALPVVELSYDCDCRKPKGGMGLRAAEDLGLDLASSWMVGDKNADLGFAKSLGLKGVLVLSGYGEDTLKKLEAKGQRPERVAADLSEAAEIILKA